MFLEGFGARPDQNVPHLKLRIAEDVPLGLGEQAVLQLLPRAVN